MNGKKAKRLRKAAKRLCEAHGIDPNKGKNEYNQAMNTHKWDHYIDKETGVLAKDPDGDLLLRAVKSPGTIRHAHKEKVAYRLLKKLSKQGRK